MAKNVCFINEEEKKRFCPLEGLILEMVGDPKLIGWRYDSQ
jgi:hypothetical protein